MRKVSFVLTLVGFLAVAGIAAWVSYWHGVSVLVSHHQTAYHTHHVVPITADGLMAVAGQAMWRHRGGSTRRRWPSVVAFLLGAVAMLGGNWLAADNDPIAHVVSLWPGVALVLAVTVVETRTVHVSAVRAPARRPVQGAVKGPAVKPVRLSHKACDHAPTASAQAACRKARLAVKPVTEGSGRINGSVPEFALA